MLQQKIAIDDEMPEEAEEKLVQLAFHAANLIMEVFAALEGGARHPGAVLREVESPVILAPQPPGGPKRVELVGILLPRRLANEIKNTAVAVSVERREKAEGDPSVEH